MQTGESAAGARTPLSGTLSSPTAKTSIHTMLAFAQRFPAWKDFPKGLHVLVLDEDKPALNDAKLKLEACNYSVTAFSSGQAALEAIQDQNRAFHLAIVEVNPTNAADSFDIIGAAKHLPTILMSNTKNVTIMMEGIAAGASEFMQKPLSEDKLKNIWQHVFRKALSTGELVLPMHLSLANDHKAGEVNGVTTLQMIKEPSDPCSNAETLALMQVEAKLFFEEYTDEGDHHDVLKLSFLDEVKPDLDDNLMPHSAVRSPGPSTPQLEQAERVVNISDDGSPLSQDFAYMKAGLEDDNSTDDCSSFVHVKSEMENMDGLFQSNAEGDEFQSLHDLDGLEARLCEDEDLQFHDSLDFQDSLTLADDLVDDLSCIDMDSSILDDLPSDESLQLSLECLDDGDQHDEEALLLAEVAKAEAGMANLCDRKSIPICNSSHGHVHEVYEKKPTKSSDSDQSGKGSKSMQSKRKMKVDWTPELHRRFVQAVEQIGVDKAIPSRILEIMGVQCLTRHNIASHLQKYRSHKKHIQARGVEAATWNQRRHLEVVSRPAQSQVVSRPAPPLVPMGLHVWGHPKPWQAPDGTLWHQSPPVCLDAWGHPAPGAPLYHPSHGHPQPVWRLPLAPMPGVANRAMHVQTQAEKMFGFHPPKEKVDDAINEVLKNPFTPLPLGLKPPSLESVLSELQRQGIKSVPPLMGIINSTTMLS